MLQYCSKLLKLLLYNLFNLISLKSNFHGILSNVKNHIICSQPLFVHVACICIFFYIFYCYNSQILLIPS